MYTRYCLQVPILTYSIHVHTVDSVDHLSDRERTLLEIITGAAKECDNVFSSATRDEEGVREILHTSEQVCVWF